MADSEDMMTIEELAEVYRVEKKSGSLMTVRSDFYTAVAKLLKAQRQECDRLLAKDPDSLLGEGANTRRRKGQQLSKEIVEMRMNKICKMALRGAMGATNSIEALTPEEKKYYENILMISTNHNSIIARISGSLSYRNRDLTEPIPAPTSAPIVEEVVAPAEPELPPEEEYYEPEEEIPTPAPEPPVMEVPLDIVPEEGVVPLDDVMEETVPEADLPEDELDRMPPMETKKNEIPEAPKDIDESEFMLVRVLQDIGTVAGPVKNYNLTRESVVRMPTLFAQVLINRGMAVRISVSP
ncbi:MAG: hypothetical protein MJZ38_03920 [archaeon]|nr:hypothetical protein [archaeon]